MTDPTTVTQSPTTLSKPCAASSKSRRVTSPATSAQASKPRVPPTKTSRALPGSLAAKKLALDAILARLPQPSTPGPAAVVKPTAVPSKRRAAPDKSSRGVHPGSSTRVTNRRAAAARTPRVLPGTLMANEEAADANTARLSRPPTPVPAAVAKPTAAPSKRRAAPAKSLRAVPPGPSSRVTKRRAAAAKTPRALPGALVANVVAADARAARLSRPPARVPAAVAKPTLAPSNRRAAPAKSPRVPPPGSPARAVKPVSPLPPTLSTVPISVALLQNPTRNQTGRLSSAPTAPPCRASKRLAALRDAAHPTQGTAELAVAKPALPSPDVAFGLEPVPQVMVAALANQTVKTHAPALKKWRQPKASLAAHIVEAPMTRVRRGSPRALQSEVNRGRDRGPVPVFLSESQRAARLAAAVAHLQQVAPQVARLLVVGFAPPFRRVPLFDALARTILYQQVNGATAGVMYARIGALLYPDVPVKTGGTEGSLECPPLTAKGVLDLGADRVRGVGVSGVKARYILGAAEACERDGLDEYRLAQLDDAEVNTVLCSLPGVGAWTAAMVRMFCLERQDVLPVGDLTLRRVAAALWGKPAAAATEAECTAGRVNDMAEAAAPRKGKAPAKAQAKTSDTTRVKTVPLATEAAASAQGRANVTKMMALQPSLMADEDLERLLEVCRPFRSYAAWALWGVTDEFAFLPVGGVLERLDLSDHFRL